MADSGAVVAQSSQDDTLAALDVKGFASAIRAVPGDLALAAGEGISQTKSKRPGLSPFMLARNKFIANLKEVKF